MYVASNNFELTVTHYRTVAVGGWGWGRGGDGGQRQQLSPVGQAAPATQGRLGATVAVLRCTLGAAREEMLNVLTTNHRRVGVRAAGCYLGGVSTSQCVCPSKRLTV